MPSKKPRSQVPYNLNNIEANPLWPILVETVHKMVMYPHHKVYTRDTVLQETPDVTPQELAVRIDTSLGAAIVILKELRQTEHNE